MDFEIVTLPAFAVIGKEGQGGWGDIPQWLPPLWASANQHFPEITDLALRDGAGCPVALWGLMSDRGHTLAPWNEHGGLYLAGCQVRPDAPPPPGWTRWAVPARTYASVTCTQTENAAVWQDMVQRRLLEAGCRLAGASFERYRVPTGSDQVELLFPIEKA